MRVARFQPLGLGHGVPGNMPGKFPIYKNYLFDREVALELMRFGRNTKLGGNISVLGIGFPNYDRQYVVSKQG